MKYRELPALEINEFQIGDLIKTYQGNQEHIFYIVSVNENILTVTYKEDIYEEDTSIFHFKQCRKLVPIEPREFHLHSDGSYTGINNAKFIDREKALKVREVLEDE